MFNERAFIARIEAADPDKLARLLERPTTEEEKALRAHFGDERYQRLHSLALQRIVTRGLEKGEPAKKGNVVVIHGIMGAELSATGREGAVQQVWVNALRIVAGWLDYLRLDEHGRTEYGSAYDSRASGILKRYYGELLLSLSNSWRVRTFWFDWRKDITLAADTLNAQLSAWFWDDTPIHLVAHSMGGLVARAFIKKYPDHWKAMWDSAGKGRAGGRLIMLGTPNYGSFVIPQVITGLESIVRKLARYDLHHNRFELLTILNSFVGSYQMLPSPYVMEEMTALYKAETYSNFQINQRHLDNAYKFHKWLHNAVEPDRMIYLAGSNQPTFCNISNLSKVDSIDSYEITRLGDGRVPHRLGLLPDVPTYYVEEDHGGLSSNQEILAALDGLLEHGTTQRLSTHVPEVHGPTDQSSLQRELECAGALDEERVQIYANRIRSRGSEGELPIYVSGDERNIEDILVRGFLSAQSQEERRQVKAKSSFGSASIKIELINSLIENEKFLKDSAPTVDAIAVGHYFGVNPQAAELALDRVLSNPLQDSNGNRMEIPISELLLTQYTNRGVIRGELGQMFFLPDPRPVGEDGGGAPARTIAIAGMGAPGRFGVPELTVLVRELCWSLGRMGKRHLATVLIGAGNGNLSEHEAIGAWMRGIKYALTGSIDEQHRCLEQITFLEAQALKIENIQKAIIEEKERLQRENRLKVDYTPFSKSDLQRLWHQGREERDATEVKKRQLSELVNSDSAPTRITVSLEGKTYRFGAITESASIPEREIPLDPELVMRANEELAAEWDRATQLDRGRFMELLLLPEDLREQLTTNAPVVMLLDATTARIHWEILAHCELLNSPSGQFQRDGARGDLDEYFLDSFVGTSRGFTRQLRSTFAPPPDPPPPPRRFLRVLVVADPAEDARLVGAEEEGVAVADLFEHFNTFQERSSENRVEVVRLFGPREATRTNVLRHLILRSYDVLHFAGHCTYDARVPSSSGWIFSNGERLAANELRRIDRVPKFVFSNACESGITPDRSELRSVDLAPSFAEAFFARGVSNFVCTAWPVDDAAARDFAITLYAALLGLPITNEQSADSLPATSVPQPMHKAMRAARLAIARTPSGVRTWGAYQHYGSPNFRLFRPKSASQGIE